MGYIKLINRAWVLREQGILSAQEHYFYCFLLHRCNKARWQTPFILPTVVICAILGISRNKLLNHRRKLQQLGLIEFKEGSAGGGKPAEYSLCIHTDTLSDTLSDTLTCTSNDSVTEKEKEPSHSATRFFEKNKTLSRQRNLCSDMEPAGCGGGGGEEKTKSDPANDCATQASTCGKARAGKLSRERLRNASHDLRLDDGGNAFERRKNAFMNDCATYVPTYGRTMIRAFFDYWTEPNKSKTKMRFELEKTWDLARRIRTWENNELKLKKNGTKKGKISDEELLAAVAAGIARAESDKE
jgi:hypothetical protein